jgi:hypothetical protein
MLAKPRLETASGFSPKMLQNGAFGPGRIRKDGAYSQSLPINEGRND